MCVETWRMYLHCGCRTYLSTYICNAARGQHKDDDNVLAKTKFLPDKPPRAPPKCKVKTATSPSSASCPRCEREKRKAGTSAATQPARATPVPAALQDQRLKESPGPQAAERVRNSLILLEKYRKPSGESVK